MKDKMVLKRTRYKSILSILCMVALIGTPGVGLVRAASVTITVFDHEYSNWDHPAITTITLPCVQSIESIRMEMTGYCDVNGFGMQAVHFDLDGKGGYIGTERLGPAEIDDLYGYGIIYPGEIKTWEYDLSYCQFPNDWVLGVYGGSHYLDFRPDFTPGTHTVTAYITDKDYWSAPGLDSWISIKLYFEYTPCVAGSLFSDALGILPLAALVGALVVLHRRRRH